MIPAVAVKVGKTSGIRLGTNVQAVRAVTFTELEFLLHKMTFNAVILAGVRPEEIIQAKRFAEYAGSAGQEMYLYCEHGVSTEEAELSEAYGITIVTSHRGLRQIMLRRWNIRLHEWGLIQTPEEDSQVPPDVRKSDDDTAAQDALKALEAQLVQEKEKIKHLKMTLDTLREQIRELNNELEMLTEQKCEAETEAADKTLALNTLYAEENKRIEELNQTKGLLDELRASYEAVRMKQAKEKNHFEEMMKDREEQYRKEYETLKDTIRTRESEYQELNDELKKKSQELETYRLTHPEIGAECNTQEILSELETVKKKEKLLSEKVAETEERYGRLEEVNKQLKEKILTIKAIGGGSTEPVTALSAGRIKLSCDYHGRGYIIPVFGSGSYGITTMAVSLAEKIQKASVVYMDFDMSSPKADSWFKKAPLIKELEDISNPLYRSGLGALLDKGSRYVISHEEQIFQRVMETKSGLKLDYFSGLYGGKPDLTKLMSTDFSGLFAHLGNKYNYIIADLGRLGSSDAADAMTQMFSGIAHKNVIVSLNNKFDVRIMNMKLNSEKIHLDKSIWILNMSDSSGVDPVVKKCLGDAKPVIMPKEMSIYGTGQTYGRIPVLKDRLMEVMGYILE